MTQTIVDTPEEIHHQKRQYGRYKMTTPKQNCLAVSDTPIFSDWNDLIMVPIVLSLRYQRQRRCRLFRYRFYGW